MGPGRGLTVLVAVVVPLLGLRYPRSRPAVTAFLGAWIRGSLLVVLALAPLVGLGRLQLSVLPRLALPFQLAVLAVWGLLLAMGLYLWHFLDAVPLLEVPSTLSWDRPPGLRRRPRRPARAGLQAGGHPAVLAAFTGYWARRRARGRPRIPHLDEGGGRPAD